MGVVALCAALDVAAAVGVGAEIFGFVVAINACLKDRHRKQRGKNTAMGQVANKTLTGRYRCVSHLIRSVPCVATSTLIDQIGTNTHAIGVVVTAPATALCKGGMNGRKARRR